MRRFLLFTTLLFVTPLALAQVYTDTKGRLEVSASGSSVYTLPIALPPSAADTGPVINIVYTSGSFGGIAGQGWNIQSISTISRMASRRDIDGYTDGVDFDENDKLALDGQRLILKSGTYWASGAVYQTETQSNTKIELKGPSYARYFVVTAPDGSRSWYGNYGGVSATDVTSWYIVRFEDTNGNYITYQYDKPFGKSLCISQINFSGSVYGETAGLLNSIRFHYKDAQRIEFAYIGGVKHEKRALLERVEVHSGGTLFRNYALTHSVDPILGYERLSQIQEFNPKDEGANPVLFDYDTTETLTEGSEYKTTYNNPLDFKEIVHSGDFDGDGHLDFITNDAVFTGLFMGEGAAEPIPLPFEVVKWEPTLVATTLSNNRLNSFHSLVRPQVLDNELRLTVYNLQGNTIIPSYSKTLPLVNTTTQTGCHGEKTFASPASNYLEGDFNGDGVSEVLFTTMKAQRIHYSMQESREEDQRGEISVTYSCDMEWATHQGYDLFVVDLNPNSSTELGSPGYVHIEDVGDFDLGTYSKKYVMDFNGDGKSDILSIKPDKTYKVIGFKELNTAPYMEVELLGSGTLPHYGVDKQLLFGDFNGDAKVDLLLPQADKSELWRIYYANPQPGGGSFFVEQAHQITPYRPHSGTDYKTQTHLRNYYALDTNGDGKTDLVEVWRRYYKPKWTINDHNTQWKVTTFVNTIGKSGSSGFTKDYKSTTVHDSDSPALPIPVVGHYWHLGANKELVMVRNHHNELTYIDFTKDVARDNLLTKVTTSGGDQTWEIVYKPMEKGTLNPYASITPLYSVTNPAQYPYVSIEKSLQTRLVFMVKRTAMGTTWQQNFKYQNFTVHKDGLGPLGFEKTARSAWFVSHSDPRLWSVQENDINLRGALQRSYTKLSQTGMHFRFSDQAIPADAIALTTNEYITSLSQGKVYSLLLHQKTVSDLLLGTKVATDYSYDPQYNLPVSVTTRHFSGEVVQQTHSVTTQYDNNPEGAEALYYIGRPDKLSTHTTAYGDVYTTEERYRYDTKGNVIQLEQQGHQTETLTETMSYDGYGNIKTKTLTAPGMALRTERYTYDPGGRFVIQKTDVEGLETHYTYHPLYGLVLTETNPYTLTTTYTYDGWGKKTEVKDYLGHSTRYRYTKSQGKYTTFKEADDGVQSLSVRDLLGNVIRSGTKDLNGNFSYVRVNYDDFNRKIAESAPYFGSPSKWSSIQYDAYGRVVKTIAQSGRITSITYNGLTTTVNDGVKTVSTTKDAMGNSI
ncbi:MAG: SpvB/TcaC N-terminal domain-containing protein, partial [Bacteroidota bacterium]